ncbi:MAG TPA: DUF167 domain-containing protein [Catalimonadaceae bacterium]|nr:DUF167 domain-containing protein [Catalimonadaceae bacterium]HPI12350.1 DUF167 domain-containing protein [Catalimonadaceae bacterium]
MEKATFLVKPNARSSSIGRSEDGQMWIRIAAPATEGKANSALIAFLSKLVGIPKSRISLVNGASGRHKTFSFDMDKIDWDALISKEELP